METNPHLRALLLEKERVSSESLSDIEQQNDQCHLIERLTAVGLIDEAELAADLAQRTGRPRVSLDEAAPEERAVACVAGPLCAHFLVVPIEISSSSKGPHLVLAMADPLDVEAIRAVHAEADMRISPLVASASEVRRAIERTYGLSSPVPSPAKSRDSDDGGDLDAEDVATIRPQVFIDLFEDMDADQGGLLKRLRNAQSDGECQAILRAAVQHAESDRDRLLFGLTAVLLQTGAVPRQALLSVLSDSADQTWDQGADA